jgi:hypothetical protein
MERGSNKDAYGMEAAATAIATAAAEELEIEDNENFHRADADSGLENTLQRRWQART